MNVYEIFMGKLALKTQTAFYNEKLQLELVSCRTVWLYNKLRTMETCCKQNFKWAYMKKILRKMQ